MRKTRLVILPAKCLHQIGFLLLFLSCPVIGDWGRIHPESENLHRSIQIQREGTCGFHRDSSVRTLDILYSNGSDQWKKSEIDDFTKHIVPIILKSNAETFEQISTKRQNIGESLQRRVAETRKYVENLERGVVRRNTRWAPRSESDESRRLLESRSRLMEQRQNENTRSMPLSRFNDRRSNISQKNEERKTNGLYLGRRVENRRNFIKELKGETELMVRATLQRRYSNRQVRETKERRDFKREVRRHQGNSEIQNTFLTIQRRVERDITVTPERRERGRELRNNGLRSLERREERVGILASQKEIEKEYERRGKRKLIRQATERSVVNLAEPRKTERLFQAILEGLVRVATENEGQETERTRRRIREKDLSRRLSQPETDKEQHLNSRRADMLLSLKLRKITFRTWRSNIRREIETTRLSNLFPTIEASDKRDMGRLKPTRLEFEPENFILEKTGLDGKANENEFFSGFLKWMGLNNYNRNHSKIIDWTTNCVVGAIAYFVTSRKVKAV